MKYSCAFRYKFDFKLRVIIECAGIKIEQIICQIITFTHEKIVQNIVTALSSIGDGKYFLFFKKKNKSKVKCNFWHFLPEII